ncbi:MAG: hypothetical protein Q9216_002852 [Gyalolechia sp. 2 TL-2023]
MEVVGLSASVTTLINVTVKTIKYLNQVKGASDERLWLAAETSTLLPLLFDLRNQVDQKSNGEAWFDNVRLLGVEKGPIDQLREALVHLTEKLKPKPKGGLKNLTRAFIWPFNKEYCEELLRKVERVKNLVSLAVQRDTFKLGQAIKEDTARLPLIDERVSTIAQRTDNQQINEEGKANLFKWYLSFSADLPSCSNATKRDPRMALSAEFLQDTARYHYEARRRHRPVASRLVRLQALVVRSTSHSMLSGDSYVISTEPSRHQLGEVVTDMYRKHNSGKTRPTWADIVRVFEDTTNHLNTAYLVIDALDECSEDTRQKILRYFKALPANIRLLVTTRHIDEITCEFIDSPKVEIRADSSDLRKYIASRIASSRGLEDCIRNDSSLKTSICDKITTKADGMFLAAKLHVDALSTKTNKKALKKALENLSSDLNVLYDDALLRIESQNQDYRELAEKALRWVAYTYQRLPVRALQEALAIDPDETDFDNDAMDSSASILDACAGLLTLDMESGTVRLVHYTAQDYFDKIQSTRFNNVHATIACDCVTYISYDCFQHPKNSSGHGTEGSTKEWNDSEESSGESSGNTLTSSIETSFLWYASHFWAQHAKMANRDAHLSTKIQQFLVGDPRVLNEHNWQYDWPISQILLKPRHRLAIATFFRLCDELEGFCKDIGKVNILIDNLEILHLAAEWDQASAIQILLDHGADIERRNYPGLTPLHYAIYHEALNAATALVNRGADVMAQAPDYDNLSLSNDYIRPIAFVNGDSLSQFLELLLGAGAKTQIQDIFDQKPLVRALIKLNDIETTEKLFEQLSTEQPTEKRNSKALVYAADEGATRMVDKLLMYGADINSVGKYGWTALHSAFRNGSIDQVNQLLVHGADINIHDKYGQTALLYAAEGNDIDCLLAVLRSDVDVNEQSSPWKGTALHLASMGGDLPSIKVLLAHEANMEVQDWEGKTALISAQEKGKEDCVLTLLHNGANANAQDKFGVTALHMASWTGSLKMAHELCKHHATVGIRSKPLVTFKTRISSTAWLELTLPPRDRFIYNFDRYKIFSGLVNGELRHSVLEASLLKGPFGMTDLFSAREEFLDIRVFKEGMTALDLAIFNKHEEIVRLLKYSAQSVTESNSITFEEYLLDRLGVSSLKEAEEEIDRMVKEEEQEQERRIEGEREREQLELSSESDESEAEGGLEKAE